MYKLTSRKSEEPTRQPAAGKASAREVRKGKLARYLARPLVLEESGPPRILRQLLFIISISVGAGLAWAAATEVTETAVTRGQIMPAGSVHLVEHLEGGIVDEILVQDGQVITEAQPLMRLVSAQATAELESLQAREAGLASRAERLRAFVAERAPDFSKIEDYPELVADQEAILELQEEARSSQQEVLLSRIDQRRIELKGLDEQKGNLDKQIRITTEQVQMRRNLVDKGLDSRVNLLDSERRLTEIRGDLLRVMGAISQTREAMHEAEGSLVELEATLRNDALREMGDVTAQLAEVRESRARLEDRVVRLTVVAPVGGVVQGLVTRTIGSVVAPGELLMEIVPMDDGLVAEVQILPRDIGHLAVGQPAKVKVTSYDVARFGALKGKLQYVSASTFQDEEGEPFFKGIISLDRYYVGDNPIRNLVLPGMIVDADISTGRKTLLQYLLKPVYRALDSSFRER